MLRNLHYGAKGLEWDYVWIRNVTYKNVPFQRSLNENGDAGLEEERRMFYVAFTRAKKEVEGFNFDPRKHSTITVYKNGQYCTYVLDKRTHQVLA